MFRYHGDIDFMVAEKDIEKVREALEGTDYDFSDDRFDNKKRFTEGVGHTQGEHEVIANHKDNEFHLGFFLFRREPDQTMTIREYFMQDREDGQRVPMVLERHYPKELVNLEYSSEEIDFEGTRFRTSTPESVYAKKMHTRNEKDMLDIAALKDKVDHGKIAESKRYKITLKVVEAVQINKGQSIIKEITPEQLTKMEVLDRGACSTVYKYGTDTVIKVLNQSGLELHNEETFSNIVGIENSTCVFPRDRVYIDGTFQGYTMECVQGRPLHESIRGMDLDQLMAAIQLVEGDLKKLSLERILFQDLNQGSIMWDDEKGRIKIIDTDFFVKDENIQPEACYKHNMKAFNTIMEMELGILNGQDTVLLNYLRNNPIFWEAYHQYILASIKGENKSVRELIGKAVEVFEKEFGVKVKSIEEMEQLIRERTGCDGEKPIKRESIPIFTTPTAGGNLLETAIEATEEITTQHQIDRQLEMIIQGAASQEHKTQGQVENDLIG